MSKKELHRIQVIERVVKHGLNQTDAAQQLDVSARQMRRLVARFREHGPDGLISKQRGQPSNHRLPDSTKKQAIAIIRERYHDFGPTLASEKLAELHDIHLCIETLRVLMIENGLWKTRAQKAKRAYQPRYRRDCYGELIQIDGSEHDWFEDRGPKCTLLVYVDDATSKLMELQFVKAESTFTYFDCTKRYIKNHGKPVAFYSDKLSVFRVNAKNAKGGDEKTQFARALSELNIDNICAETCQAKGRVERANKTLQDRLVKEMRLQGISNVKEGNKFLPTFMKQYNSKFGKPPLNPHNAHRDLQAYEDLDDVFCWQEARTVSNNLTIQYNKRLYLLENTKANLKLKRKRVLVYDHPNGSIKIKYEGTEIPYSILHDKLQKIDPGAIVENKRLGAVLAYINEKQAELDCERSKSAPKR